MSRPLRPRSSSQTQTSSFDILPELLPEQNYPQHTVHPTYIDLHKVKQFTAKRRGQPIHAYSTYDPNGKRGTPIEYGTRIPGQSFKEYPAPTGLTQTDPGYDKAHREEQNLPKDAVGRRNVFGEFFGMPLEGPADWTEYYKEWPDVGPQLYTPPPFNLPLDQPELDFCKKYQITFGKELGSGGFGAVWHCIRRQKDDKGNVSIDIYACKIIDIKTFMLRNTLHEAVTKMLREANIIKDLNHDNIVKVEQVFHIHDQMTGFPMVRTLFFMTLCDGDLNGLLKQKSNKKLTENEAKRVMCDVCQGLKYLHDHHIIHFDIKPANILYKIDSITGQLCFKLSDFGLAKRFADADTKISTAGGTDRFKAPELNRKGQSDAKKADIFSLGSTLIEMLVSKQLMEECRRDFWPPNLSKPIPSYAPDPQKMQTLENKWQLSPSGTDLIRKMTILEEVRRPNIEQVIADPWFTITAQIGVMGGTSASP